MAGSEATADVCIIIREILQVYGKSNAAAPQIQLKKFNDEKVSIYEFYFWTIIAWAA